MNLEADIEIGNFDQQSVDDLLELYTEAVEFYNARMDKKYKVYELKMQQLLVKPEILAMM